MAYIDDQTKKFVIKQRVVTRITLTKYEADLQKCFLAEARLSFDSPYLIHNEGHTFYTKGEKAKLLTVSKYYGDGNLEKYLLENRGTSDERAQIFYHVLLGLRILSQKKIIHRDLKPANILLSRKTATIIDFGFHRRVADVGKRCLFQGTFRYIAPELMWYQIRDPSHLLQAITEKNDIWSAGIIGYWAFGVGKHCHPFKNAGKSIESFIEELVGIYESKTLEEFPDPPSHSIASLVKKMLAVRPEERISIDDAITEFEQIYADKIANGTISRHKEQDY